MKKILVIVAGILALGITALPAAAATVKSDVVLTQNLSFVQAFDAAGFESRPDPSAELQPETREHVAIGLLLPAVQKARCHC